MRQSNMFCYNYVVQNLMPNGKLKRDSQNTFCASLPKVLQVRARQQNKAKRVVEIFTTFCFGQFTSVTSGVQFNSLMAREG